MCLVHIHRGLCPQANATCLHVEREKCLIWHSVQNVSRLEHMK